MVVRWNDSTHGADLRGRVAQGEVRLDQLDPATLWNLAVAHYSETIPEGQNAKQTVTARFRRILQQIRSELEFQGARRRAGGGKEFS
jgi:hypothetical protein